MVGRLTLAVTAAAILLAPTATSLAAAEADDTQGHHGPLVEPGPHPDRGAVADGTFLRHEIRDVGPPGCLGSPSTWAVNLTYVPHDAVLFFEVDEDPDLVFDPDHTAVVEDGHGSLTYESEGACPGEASIQVTGLSVTTTADYRLDLNECTWSSCPDV